MDIQEDKFILPILFLFILLVIGVPGNLTVMIIYGLKYSPSIYRSVIVNLAVIDFVVSAVGIPFNIVRIFHFYNYSDKWSCKVFTTLMIFGIFYSTHLLVLLSVHRYRQICMPIRRQFTKETIRYYIIGCSVVGVLLSWPQFVLIDVEMLNVTLVPNDTMDHYTCPISASDPSRYTVAYSIFSTSLFFLYTVILFILYFFISRKLYYQRKRQRSHSQTTPTKTDKITKIAFTISVVFALSYIPLFSLKLAKSWFDENDLSDLQFTLLRVAERLYLVNHVANPFIYAAFDSRFRFNFKRLASFKFQFRNNIRRESNAENELANFDKVDSQ